MGSRNKTSKGFTLIEILVVIGIIAILASIVIIAINPARQFAQARNSQRTSNVNAILNAVGQYIADNKGLLPASVTALGNDTPTAIGGGAGGVNLCSTLVPTYMPALTVDPVQDPDGAGAMTAGQAAKDTDCPNVTTTGYTIAHDATNRITVCELLANIETAIPNSTQICVTR